VTSFSEFRQAQGHPRAGSRRASVVPPQARSFQGRRAGLVTRAIASGLDVAFISATTFGLYLAFVVVNRFLTPWFSIPVPSVQVFVAIGLACMWLYATWSWSAAGRTLGGHLMGLRVLDRRGEFPGLAQSAVRAVCCMVFPLGLLWVPVSRAQRSVQDLLVGTRVEYDWVMELPTRMPRRLRKPTAHPSPTDR
jgi:uncharacterized RDD family membrane protein YckC